MLAEWARIFRRAVDGRHVYEFLVDFCKFFPDWLELLAVAAPRRKKLDKPWLVADHRKRFVADDLLVE